MTSDIHAEEVRLPALSTDNLEGVNVFTTYQSDNRYTVNIQVQYQVGSALEVPETITYFSMDQTQIFTIPVKQEFIAKNNPIVANETPLSEEELRAIEQLHEQDLLREKIQAEKTQFYTDFITCLETFEREQPIRYEGWFRTSEVQDYLLPDKVPTDNNLDSFEKAAKKKHQECVHMMNFVDVGPWEANKIIDGNELGPGLDTSDSPLTVEITDADILAEAKRAEASEKTYQDPNQEFEGVNRGNPYSGESKDDLCQPVSWIISPSGQICPLKDKLELESGQTNTSLTQQEAIAKQAACDHYAPLYTHSKSAWENKPIFLAHCEFKGDE